MWIVPRRMSRWRVRRASVARERMEATIVSKALEEEDYEGLLDFGLGGKRTERFRDSWGDKLLRFRLGIEGSLRPSISYAGGSPVVRAEIGHWLRCEVASSVRRAIAFTSKC